MPAEQNGRSAAAAFDQLLAPHLEAAYRTAFRLTHNREEAEDLVQEAALAAFRNYAGFHSGTNFRAWFFRILINRFNTRYRQEQRSPVSLTLEEELIPTDVPERSTGRLREEYLNPADLVLQRLSEEQIVEAIQSLPEEVRLTCLLYFMEELSYREIADILQIPIGTVRSRLHRGRRLLQAKLRDSARDEGVPKEISPR